MSGGAAAPLAVVLSAPVASETLATALARFAEGAAHGLVRRLVMVSPPALDDLAEAVGAARHDGPPLAAAAATPGDWALYWRAEVAPPTDWAALVQRHIAAGALRPACFGLTIAQRSWRARAVEAQAALETRLFGRPWPQQGLLTPRLLLHAPGAPWPTRLAGAAEAPTPPYAEWDRL